MSRHPPASETPWTRFRRAAVLKVSHLAQVGREPSVGTGILEDAAHPGGAASAPSLQPWLRVRSFEGARAADGGALSFGLARGNPKGFPPSKTRNGSADPGAPNSQTETAGGQLDDELLTSNTKGQTRNQLPFAWRTARLSPKPARPAAESVDLGPAAAGGRLVRRRANGAGRSEAASCWSGCCGRQRLVGENAKEEGGARRVGLRMAVGINARNPNRPPTPRSARRNLRSPVIEPLPFLHAQVRSTDGAGHERRRFHVPSGRSQKVVEWFLVNAINKRDLHPPNGYTQLGCSGACLWDDQSMRPKGMRLQPVQTAILRMARSRVLKSLLVSPSSAERPPFKTRSLLASNPGFQTRRTRTGPHPQLTRPQSARALGAGGGAWAARACDSLPESCALGQGRSLAPPPALTIRLASPAPRRGQRPQTEPNGVRANMHQPRMSTRPEVLEGSSPIHVNRHRLSADENHVTIKQ